MGSEITYKASVAKDLRRIGKQEVRRIISKLESALDKNPDAGIPLKGEFQGLFKYRVGDYRVIYTKVPGRVLVLRIAHRKDIYR